MTEEYRVPDGMVGLSECGSLWGRAVSCEPPPAQKPWLEGLLWSAVLCPTLPLWARRMGSSGNCYRPLDIQGSSGEPLPASPEFWAPSANLCFMLLFSPPSHWQRR
jgi:hypothetical protein